MNTRRLTLTLLVGCSLLTSSLFSSAAGTPAVPGSGPSLQLPAVEAGWVRSSVAGQQGTGAFMKLTAPKAIQLVGVSTPVAGVAELHEMKMDGDVMRMRPVRMLDLPAGRTIELKPGGYHLMLMDLKQPLAVGSTVPLTLHFRDAGGAERQLELKLPVAIQPPGASAHPASGTRTH
jgi:copper(I)-binding protein